MLEERAACFAPSTLRLSALQRLWQRHAAQAPDARDARAANAAGPSNQPASTRQAARTNKPKGRAALSQQHCAPPQPESTIAIYNIVT